MNYMTFAEKLFAWVLVLGSVWLGTMYFVLLSI